MYIEKDNLLIRKAVVNDASLLAGWWNDGKVMAHAGFPNGLGIAEEAIRKGVASEKNNLLILEINHSPVGEMNYRIVEENTAQIGIKICEPAAQSKGYGTQFLNMLLTYLFEQLHCEKVILDTNLKNTRAQHVYEKLGFEKIRVNIDSWQDQLGELQSSVDYELSKAEFNKRSRGI